MYFDTRSLLKKQIVWGIPERGVIILTYTTVYFIVPGHFRGVCFRVQVIMQQSLCHSLSVIYLLSLCWPGLRPLLPTVESVRPLTRGGLFSQTHTSIVTLHLEACLETEAPWLLSQIQWPQALKIMWRELREPCKTFVLYVGQII